MGIVSSIKSYLTSKPKTTTSAGAYVKPATSPTPSVQPTSSQSSASNKLYSKLGITQPSIVTQTANRTGGVSSSVSSSVHKSSSSPTGYSDSLGQPVSVNTDASFTQGTSVYNPATKQLESNKVVLPSATNNYNAKYTSANYNTPNYPSATMINFNSKPFSSDPYVMEPFSQQNPTRLSRVLTAPEKIGGIEGVQYSINRNRRRVSANTLRGGNELVSNIKGFGFGVGTIAVGTLVFGKSLITHPIATGVGTVGTVYTTARHPLETGATVGTVLREEPGYATGIVAGVYATGKVINFGSNLGVKGYQSINLKLNPNAIAFESSGVKLVEGTTIPTKIKKLSKIEGTRIDTIHATVGDVGHGTILKPITEGATGWRKSVGQFNFYQSVPSEGKPVLYGGYVGIGEQGSSSVTKFSLFNPKIKAIIFRGQEISETPSAVKVMNIKNIVRYQTKTPGTYIPAENIKLMSTEGQVTTSVGEINKPIFKIAENPSGDLYNKFSYYNQKAPASEFISNKPLLQKSWDIFTSKNKKINFVEAKLEKIGEGSEFTQSKGFDFRQQAESSGTKYVSSGSIFKSAVSYAPTISIPSSSFKSSSRSKGYSIISSGSTIPKISSGSLGSAGYSPKISVGSFGSSGSSFGSSGSSFSSSFRSLVGSSGSYFGSSGGSYLKYTYPIITPPILPNFGFDTKQSTKVYKGKQRKKYTPSFSALVFNIKGKAPKKERGINIRPITKGFTWSFNKAPKFKGMF